MTLAQIQLPADSPIRHAFDWLSSDFIAVVIIALLVIVIIQSLRGRG